MCLFEPCKSGGYGLNLVIFYLQPKLLYGSKLVRLLWRPCNLEKSSTSSVSPELLQRFARALARVAFLRNMALLSINMKAIWRASFLKSWEQADQCNNSGETEEVLSFYQLKWTQDLSKWPKINPPLARFWPAWSISSFGGHEFCQHV